MEFIRNTHIDFMSFRRKAYVLSIILIIFAVIGFIKGMNYGVDFAGGTIIQYKFNKAVSAEDFRLVLAQFKLQNSIFQRFSDEEIAVRTIKLDNAQKVDLEKAMRDKFGDLTITRVEDVGPTVG